MSNLDKFLRPIPFEVAKLNLTSYDWYANYAIAGILDPDGWSDLEYKATEYWYTNRITLNEFKRRYNNSTVSVKSKNIPFQFPKC